MRKGRRSWERLFYLGRGWARAANFLRERVAGEGAGATVVGALVRWTIGFCLLTLPGVVWAQPSLTTISDTVYRADGTAAGGVALISWPSFQTSGGNAVAAGTKTVTIGTAGAFSTQLVPNAGATPAGTFYTVVFQLDDGTVRGEYWAVGTTTPTTIAAIRTVPGTGTASGLVSKQYVDAAVASRAADTAVVHLAGAETIQGTKQFSTAPGI